MAAGEARFFCSVDNIVPNFRESVLDHGSDPFKGSGIKEIGENGSIFHNSSNYVHNAFAW